MSQKPKRSNMFVPTLIMGIIAIGLTILAYSQGDGKHLTGLNAALKMTIAILPMLIFAFIIAGMVQILLPKEFIAKWIGADSGLKGIFIGAIAGGLTPGGPYVSLPIAAGFLKSGASVGTMVSFITGWSLYAFARLPLEFGIMGWKFTLIRIVSILVFPPIAGLIAQLLFGHVRL